MNDNGKGSMIVNSNGTDGSDGHGLIGDDGNCECECDHACEHCCDNDCDCAWEQEQ